MNNFTWSAVYIPILTGTSGAKSFPTAIQEYLANIIHSYVIDITHQKKKKI